MRKKKPLNLEVIMVGKPSIEALSKDEQRVFLETILDYIRQLNYQSKENADNNLTTYENK